MVIYAYNHSTQEEEVGEPEFEVSRTQNNQINLTATHGTLPTLIVDDSQTSAR